MPEIIDHEPQDNTPAPPPAPSQDSKNLALLCWLGSTLLGFIPGLAFYLVKKDDDYVQDQAKEALNWSITFFLLLVVGKVLSIILVGFLVIGAAWLCHLLFCIMGAVAASDGKPFRVPFALRLIQ
jgi:uncharacterized Tic20 family protein